VTEVDATHGLEFVLDDHSRIGCSVYGQSLVGDIFGYRRARIAAQRYVAWRASETISRDAGGAVRKRVRAGILPAAPLWPATFALFALLARIASR
jgi:hypothetical protein